MSYRSENIDERGYIYGKWMVKPGVWAITYRWINFMYLIEGDERALLIDTGHGEGNLREFVSEIADKEVLVINTHGHYDHTGGNGWWKQAQMHEKGTVTAKKSFGPIHDEWAAKLPHLDYEIKALDDGDYIDLGNRVVEIIGIPAHNESSIAILDKQSKLLFTGDELESGQVLMFVTNEEISQEDIIRKHKSNMEKLHRRIQEIDFICPAHNGIMLYPEKYITDFIALAEQLLTDSAVPQPDTAGFGFPADTSSSPHGFNRFGPLVRYQYGGASFIFKEDDQK